MPEDQASRDHSDELATAIAAVQQSPKDRSRWDRVEELLEIAQRPEAVSELFRNALGELSSPELISEVGQRGVRFYETWYGQESGELIAWLESVRAADPRAQWAFERLTVAYTAAERWSELLDAYDRAIAAADPLSRRVRLLEEAAQVAKDFASDADRAIGYMLTLNGLDPENPALSALERLLERRERWDALSELWQAKITAQPQRQAREARIRLANCFLDKLGRPGDALEQIRLALADVPGHAPAYDVLERVVVAPSARVADRREALALLKQHKIDLRQPHEVVRVLQLGLSQAGDAERRALLRELVDRLADLGEDTPAIRHQAALLVLEPSTREREALRALAQRTRDYELLTSALIEAADHCAERETAAELLLEAAVAAHDTLGDQERAALLFQRVFSSGARVELAIEAGRRLVPLLDKPGREPDMLELLGRMSEIEPDLRARKALLGRMAKLAQGLGLQPRAEQAWQARLHDDAEDVEALEALINGAAEQRQWSRLANLLEQRIRAQGASAQRRQDMVWLASTYADRLGDSNAAIEVWRRIQVSFGEDPESIAALTDLLGRAERWQELADVLGQAAAHQIARFTELQTRLGDAYRERLDQPELAVNRYASALQVDPRLEAARRGQHALLADPRCRTSAIESLLDAYERCEEWEKTLGLLEDRLSIEPSEGGRAKLLLRAAELYEQHTGDPSAALACLRRAFTLSPDNRHAEREIRRLAERLGNWDAVISTYRETIACFVQPTPRVAELRHDEGKILEERLHDARAALSAYSQASSISPERADLAAAAMRVAADLGDWELAAQQVVQCAGARGEVVPELLAGLEAGAGQMKAWEELARSMTLAISARPGVDGAVARELHARVAHWHRSQLLDDRAAEAALTRAVAADGSDLATLRALCDLQRRAPGESLCDTLLAIHELERADLDPLREAAEVARTGVASAEKRCAIWQRLYDRSAELLRAGADGRGHARAVDCERWALDQLVEALGRSGAHERAHALLVASASLPLDPGLRRDDLHRAAQIAARDLRDDARAIALYRDLLKGDPNDRRVVRELSELYQGGDHLPELLTLKRHDLLLEPSLEAQLELRLQIAALLGELEARGGRMQTLQENLRAKPAHAPTLEALGALLSSQGRFADLAELMRAQARELSRLGGDCAPAAELMRRAALLHEREQPSTAAIETYQELHTLEPTGDASAALARLYTAEGAHAQAAKWLELRVESLPANQRAGTTIELAQALLLAGEPGRAQHFLEHALIDDPSRGDAQRLLAGMYRAQRAWEPLAGLLATAAEHEVNRDQKLELWRESAGIYCDTLATPERALDGLRRAAALAEGDRDVSAKLADALAACGRFAEARTVLERLIEGFGRRRTPERAEMHYRLARVAKAAGDVSHAFDELEQATKMDPGHVAAMHMLAELNQEQGDLDRAERAYRALLMLVRRKPGERQAVGQSEVFHALSTIAEARGHQAQAEEFLESAMEAAMQSDADASRFQSMLRAQGRSELLMRLLQARLKLATDPAVLAQVLTTQAELLAGTGRRAEALDALSTALGMTPDDDGLHERARALAAELGVFDRYLKRVEALAEEAGARDDDGSRRSSAGLLLRLGEAIEQELGDLERAAALYGRVESTGLHPLPNWTAIARVAKTRGDLSEQRRAMQRIVDLGEQLNAEQRRAALLALVELELGVDAWREVGIGSLERALQDANALPPAKRLLRIAIAQSPSHGKLGELFERVARAARDPEMLLEHFERRAGASDVSWREVREGVELALNVPALARAEALLARGAALEEQELAAGERAWLFARSADCRKAAGDIKGAIAHLRDALESADDEVAEALCRELAELASGTDTELEVAAAAYHRLLEAYPGEQALWEPLLGVYRRIGDRVRFEAFAQRCVRDLLSPDERTTVHLALARFVLDVAGDEPAAVEPLKAVIEDKPGHPEATRLLSQIFERHGMDEQLADLLQVQFDRARDERDLAAIGSLGLRIGALYGAPKQQAAIDIYRSALEWLPAERPLIEALLERLADEGDLRERAELMQALLKIEAGPRAAELALRLAPIWQELYEPELMQQALELGQQACGDHQELRDQLERFYVDRQLWQPLTRLLEQEADRANSREDAVARLRRAAALYRSPIGDLEAAGNALRKALALAPDDVSLLGEMARNLAASGQFDAAVTDIGRLLDGHPSQDPQRAELLRVRAEVRLGAEDLDAAIRDLEEAHAIAKDAVQPQLIDALERLKTVAFTKGDAEAERAAVMRLVELHENGGDLPAARETLSDWVEQSPQDVEALSALLRRDQAAGRWAEAAQSCERLLEAEPAGNRTAIALELADACAKCGRPDRARDWLERIHRADLSDVQVRAALRQLYEEIGAFGELAALLLADAQGTEQSAGRVGLYQRAAQLYLKAGDASAALAPLAQAAALQPEDSQTQLLMIDLSIQLGTLEDADRTLEAAITTQKRRRSPELASLYQRKARVAAARHDSEEQLKWLNQASDIDRKSSEIASELADAAMAVANHDVAMKALRALSLMDDPKPITRAVAFLKQAQISLLRGDPRRAQHWARKAKSLDPNLKEVDALLADLADVEA